MLTLPARLQSIDVFRALTMFLMIFVNDVDGVTNIPAGIKHAPANADALGFADTIFPAFLFIVGLSVPFALQKRIQSKESRAAIAGHIFQRAFALILMGFFHVNLENYSNAALLPKAIWEILITIAFFLTWLRYKPGMSTTIRRTLQGSGILLLAVLAAVYKGEEGGSIVWMRPQWWGILGLIGWAYLTCALIYLFAKGRGSILATAFLLSLAYTVFNQTKMAAALSPVLQYCWFLGGGAELSFIMAGILTAAGYQHKTAGIAAYLRWLGMAAGIMIAFGFVIRPVGGISKIHGTPAWVGICTGLSMAVFAILVFLVDVKRRTRLFQLLRPAGTSTLTAYLIPYLLYSLMVMLQLQYPPLLSAGLGGILRSFGVAFLVIALTAFLEKKHLTLKI